MRGVPSCELKSISPAVIPPAPLAVNVPAKATNPFAAVAALNSNAYDPLSSVSCCCWLITRVKVAVTTAGGVALSVAVMPNVKVPAQCRRSSGQNTSAAQRQSRGQSRSARHRPSICACTAGGCELLAGRIISRTHRLPDGRERSRRDRERTDHDSELLRG